ncbi:hypothetical protein BaRGS_00006856 [Batillaria attramentaria]|uniref:Uncharacterized protein n=1 Tax=Batillaria attramentaria TaxID=370345 RepID=A0ABD0LSX7_9CAEN
MTLSIFAVLLFLSAYGSSQPTGPSKGTVWYGLGPRDCYGTTCGYEEFCSDDPVWKTCRNCTAVEAWCAYNVTHLKLKYPSCEAMCERILGKLVIDSLQNRTEDLMNQKVNLEDTVTQLYANLTQKEKVLAEVKGELDATGSALKASLEKEATLTLKLNDTVEVWILMVALIVTAIVLFCAFVFLFRYRNQNSYLLSKLPKDSISTASAESSCKVAGLFLPCCVYCGDTPPMTLHGQPENDGTQGESYALLLQQQPADSHTAELLNLTGALVCARITLWGVALIKGLAQLSSTMSLVKDQSDGPVEEILVDLTDMQRVDSMATDPPDDQFECEPGWVSCFRDCCERMVQFCNKRAKRCQGKTQRQSHTYYVKTEDGSPASDSLLSLESADQGKTNDGNMEEDQEQEAEETGDPVSAPPSQPSPSNPSEASRVATATPLRAEPWGQSEPGRAPPTSTPEQPQPSINHNNATTPSSLPARQVEMPEPPQVEPNQVNGGHHGPGNTTDNRGCRDSRLYNVPPTTPAPDADARYPMGYPLALNT